MHLHLSHNLCQPNGTSTIESKLWFKSYSYISISPYLHNFWPPSLRIVPHFCTSRIWGVRFSFPLQSKYSRGSNLTASITPITTSHRSLLTSPDPNTQKSRPLDVTWIVKTKEYPCVSYKRLRVVHDSRIWSEKDGKCFPDVCRKYHEVSLSFRDG